MRTLSNGAARTVGFASELLEYAHRQRVARKAALGGVIGAASRCRRMSIGARTAPMRKIGLSTTETPSNGHRNGRPDDRLTKPAPQLAQAVVWAASWRKNTSVRAYSGEKILGGNEKKLRARCVCFVVACLVLIGLLDLVVLGAG